MKHFLWFSCFFLVLSCNKNSEIPTSDTVKKLVDKSERVSTTEGLLQFDLTAEKIDSICKVEMDRLLSSVGAIANLSHTSLTFKSTIYSLETAVTEFRNAVGVATFLKYVSPKNDLREASDRCEQSVSKLFVDLFGREDLFVVLKAYKEKDEFLKPEDKFLLDEYLNDFIRNGLELPPEKRKLYLEKKKRLVELETEFAKNLVEYEDELLVTEGELDGMPASFISSLEKNLDGLYRITMAYPHVFPFLENAKNAEARRKLNFKFNNRGGDRNRQLLEAAISLRHELAVLLGKPSHAHYVLERRMAKRPQDVNEFLNKLVVRLRPKGAENLNELLELKRKELGDPTINELHAWDWRYYENLLRKTKYQIDVQKIKEYFPLEVVLKGMFEIYQTLLGVEYVALEDAPNWHKDVLAFAVKRSGKTISHFYMDLFPRDGKYEHAAAFTLQSGYLKGNGQYESPFASIVANFNPPQPSTPSLLTHSEVETLFHEFGHIMHQVLTTAKYGSYSGTGVKTDFVEAPSQMLENWVWDKEALAKLSGHYQDPSKPLPNDLLEKMVQAKLLNVGMRYLRQLSFGIIDMTYHTSPSLDSTQVYNDVMKEVMMIPVQEGTIPQASFGHLMGGYDAGYYGYLWSEVFAQDMFTRFEVEGLLNSKTGADYLKWVLQPGGLIDPMRLIKGFLGRDPNDEAFLKSLGLH